MKKVGVITFHRAYNYGAILQAHALSQKISELSSGCEIVDVLDPVESSKKIGLKRKLVLFIRSILYLDRTVGYRKRCKKIDRFVKTNLLLSKEKYNANTIYDSNSRYKVFVVGSDQVWNLSFKNNHIYLLDFVNEDNYRMSYAASFGYSKIPEQFVEHSKKSIERFDAVSVREKTGISILEEQIGIKNGVLVVDPTLLFDKEKWVSMVDLSLVKDKRVIGDEKFVLYYAVAPQTRLLDSAIETARRNNMKLVILNNSTEIKVKSAINFYDAGIEDFIFLFNKASYVFTTSFHGLAFAINFNKQFVFETSKEKNNANDRLFSLVSELGLINRSIDVIKDVNDPIDWGSANAKLQILRKRSADYLSNNLNKFLNE